MLLPQVSSAPRVQLKNTPKSQGIPDTESESLFDSNTYSVVHLEGNVVFPLINSLYCVVNVRVVLYPNWCPSKYMVTLPYEHFIYF